MGPIDISPAATGEAQFDCAVLPRHKEMDEYSIRSGQSSFYPNWHGEFGASPMGLRGKDVKEKFILKWGTSPFSHHQGVSSSKIKMAVAQKHGIPKLAPKGP